MERYPRKAVNSFLVQTISKMQNTQAQVHNSINSAAFNSDLELTKAEELNDLRKLTAARYKILEADAEHMIISCSALFNYLYSQNISDEKVLEIIEATHEVALGALSSLRRVQKFSKNLSEPVNEADGWGKAGK